MTHKTELFHKYDVPVPRYTSYPSYPFWKKEYSHESFLQSWQKNLFISDPLPLSIYIHLPFCESLCFFCGCNKVITKNHDLEFNYIQALLQEWEQYLRLLPKGFEIKELHLGGGTPTFFSASHLDYFLTKFFSSAKKAASHDFSVEIHPSVTNSDHLDVLSQHGFNRLSIGVQDFNKQVQKAIGRKQSFQEVEFCTTYARKKGFASVNFDLIYGLPFQSSASIEETLQLVYQLHPDRIAFYSYAHLPVLKPSQKKLDELYLPKGLEKYSIYEKAFQSLTENGYKDLGYDHFALKSDSLYQAFEQNNLHRNFMGFTVQNTSILIGLGVSAISDFSTFYVQNKKTLPDYLESIKNPQFLFETGYELSKEDLLIKKHILNLSCYHTTSFIKVPINEKLKETILTKLIPLIEDNLVFYQNEDVTVTALGVPFLRNICACFDQFFDLNSNSKHSKSL